MRGVSRYLHSRRVWPSRLKSSRNTKNEFPRIPEHPHWQCAASPETVSDTDAVVAQLRQDLERDDAPTSFAADQRSGAWEKVVALLRVARQLVRWEAA